MLLQCNGDVTRHQVSGSGGGGSSRRDTCPLCENCPALRLSMEKGSQSVSKRTHVENSPDHRNTAPIDGATAKRTVPRSRSRVTAVGVPFTVITMLASSASVELVVGSKSPGTYRA